jgi:hypothetical protein
MKRINYIIKQAHSGTSKKEVEKAKRLFRKAVQEGKVFGAITNNIVITFEDVNNIIWANYKDEFGATILDPQKIYEA